jgi:hypothetical protein
MPKSKEIGLDLIPKIYKQNAENIALFFWVVSQRNILPSLTIRESIERFFIYTKIDKWDTDSALVCFNRMQNDFLKETL